jgi:putative (di)nucleoside polyphosphate hydrolase
MLLNSQGQVFVGQRMDNAVDAWQMPQGGIDPGEDAQTAALRELEEETGIAAHLVTIIARSVNEHFYDLPKDMLGKIFGGRYDGQRQHWFLMRFSGSDSDIDLHTHYQEFRAWQWVSPDQLEHLIVDFKRELYRGIIAEFAPHL